MKSLNRELLKENIEKIAQYDFDHHKVFGSAYCVMQNDRILYQNCFGNTSPDGKTPVTEHTLFRLASMTKPITAVAVLILVERGLLSLSDKVSDYLPQFKDVRVTKLTEENEWEDCGKAKNDVTILHLLTHTSGIGSDEKKLKKMTDREKETLDGSLSFYSETGLDFEPGSRQQYSGTGAFDVLTKIVEIVTKTDYESFLKREIFGPCEMKNTTFVPSKDQWSQLIAMHQKVGDENRVAQMKENCVFGDYPCSHKLGGAGLVSTLADYARFAGMLLNEGKTPEKQILNEKTFRLLHTPFVSEEIMPTKERWGLGVRVIVSENHKRLPLGVYGWSGAYGSHFWIDPANKIAAVFMKNSLFDGGAGNESARNFEGAVKDSFT